MKKVFVVSIVLLIIDSIIKWLIMHNIGIGHNIQVIGSFLTITHLKNTGAAFNMFNSYQLLLGFLAIVVIWYLLKLLSEEERLTKLKIILYSMLFTGIVANLLDRIIYGGVIDYISFQIFNLNMPVFNLADTLIVISISIYLIMEIVVENKHENKSKRKRSKTR